MPRPNFFIIGAPRCGTTAWVSYLSGHPDIHFAPAKEPHYFCTDFPNFRWTRTIDEYEALFADAVGAKIVGEASVQYLYSAVAAQAIREYAPDARILAFVRPHPAFVASYHNQLLYNRDETITDLGNAWALSGRREKNIPSGCREPAFLDYKSIGAFSVQLQRYYDRFPPERIKVMRYAQWTADPRAAYLSILGFLDLEDDGRTVFAPIHGAHRHRFELVSRITQRPPSWLLGTARFAKRALGRERLNAAQWMRGLNRQEGYCQTMSPELEAEIRAHYMVDALRLEAMLGG